jgi:glycine hydroxymethyltransferase
MSLDHGGHLSHGHPKNFSGLFYEIHSYGVERGSERIDMERVRALARESSRSSCMAGASAYPRTLGLPRPSPRSRREVGALLMVDQAHIAGLVAAGVHPSPVPHADVGHDDHAQDPARPARRADRVQGGLAQEGHSAVFPGGQGGPFMHVIAAKAIALREASEPAFGTTRSAWSRTRDARARARPSAACASSRAAPTTT